MTEQPANESEARTPLKVVAPTYALGRHLQDIGRHPVLLFGNTSSGKSTILMSLIAALRQHEDVDVTLGDPIYPVGHARRDEAHDWAVDFFQRRAEAFIHNGEILPATEVTYPFLIPIDIHRTHAAQPMRLAILEGKGEWYEPSPTGASMYQAFQEEVANVVKFYDRGLSAIFVAPCFDYDDDRRMRAADIGLMGALEHYQRLRERREMDSLLFLLSKWDVHAAPISDPKFGTPDADDILSVLDRQFPDAWRKFKAMPRALGNERWFFMQYVAGYIVDEANHDPPERQLAAFQQYPKILLNWLYGNASETGDVVKRREVLFPDAQLPTRVRIRILQQVTNFILAR